MLCTPHSLGQFLSGLANGFTGKCKLFLIAVDFGTRLVELCQPLADLQLRLAEKSIP